MRHCGSRRTSPSWQSYLRRGTHQRKLCGQLCRTHISPAVSVSKKKGARIGRAAGERHRPLKKLNQICDPKGSTRVLVAFFFKWCGIKCANRPPRPYFHSTQSRSCSTELSVRLTCLSYIF